MTLAEDKISRRALMAGGAALMALAFAGPVLAQSATVTLSPRDLALVDRATKYLQALAEVEGRF